MGSHMDPEGAKTHGYRVCGWVSRRQSLRQGFGCMQLIEAGCPGVLGARMRVSGQVSFGLSCGLGQGAPWSSTESSSPGGEDPGVCTLLVMSLAAVAGSGLRPISSPWSLLPSPGQVLAGARSGDVCAMLVSTCAPCCRLVPWWVPSASTRGRARSMSTQAHGRAQIPTGQSRGMGAYE